MMMIFFNQLANWDHRCLWEVHCPFLDNVAQNLLTLLVTTESYEDTSARVWHWSGGMHAVSILACVLASFNTAMPPTRIILRLLIRITACPLSFCMMLKGDISLVMLISYKFC